MNEHQACNEKAKKTLISSFILSTFNEGLERWTEKSRHGATVKEQSNLKRPNLGSYEHSSFKQPRVEISEVADIGVYSDEDDNTGAERDLCEIEEDQDETLCCHEDLLVTNCPELRVSNKIQSSNAMLSSIDNKEFDEIEDIVSSPESVGSTVSSQVQPDVESSPNSPVSLLSDSKKQKAGEWIAHMQACSRDTARVLANADVTPCRTNSAKKLHNHQFVPHGLAERLSRITEREKSDIAFWKLQARIAPVEKAAVQKQGLLLKILSLANAYSLFVGSCEVCESVPGLSGPVNTDLDGCHSRVIKLNDISATCNAGDQLIVSFSLQTATLINLRVGSIVKIQAPWQFLYIERLKRWAVLCTYFCEGVGYSPVKDNTVSPVPCHQKGTEGMYSLPFPEMVVSPPEVHVLCTPHHPKSHIALQTDQKTLAPTRLFPHPEKTDNLGPKKPEFNSEHHLDLAKAIESSCNGIVSFSAFLVHLYRKNVQVILQPEIDESVTCSSSMLTKSLLHKAKHRVSIPDVHWSWALLLCDSNGVYAELHFPEGNTNEWDFVLQTGQGKLLHVANVRVLHRTTANRAPEVYNLISSLRFQVMTSQVSESFQRGSTNFASKAGPLVYLLAAESGSIFKLSDKELPKLSSVTCSSCSPPQPLSCMDILAKVVYTYLNQTGGPIAFEEMGEDHQLDQMQSTIGYLFVATPGLSGESGLIKVHLKPSFCMIGLLRALKRPGTGVYLQAVEVYTHGSEACYSMNACSLLYIATEKLLDPDIVYPKKIFNSYELQLLASIETPKLPMLVPHDTPVGSLVSVSGIIRGIDEENAYSWTTCNHCGGSDIGTTQDVESSALHGNLRCMHCEQRLIDPVIHLHLIVILSCSGFEDFKIHVKLLESTIQQLLPISVSTIDEGFDLHLILNNSLTLKSCYLLAAPNRSTVFLEEVDTMFRHDNEN